MAVNSTVVEAQEFMVAALESLCRTIEVHNITSHLIHQLNSQHTVNVTILQQQIGTLVAMIQQSISEHDVFNTSQQLIESVTNISIPTFDVDLVQSMVHDVVENITELIIVAYDSLEQLEVLEDLADDLNVTAKELLMSGAQLRKEADDLFMISNKSFFRAKQGIEMAQSYIDNVTELHDNLTITAQILNDNITDLITILEEAENITEVAYNSSVDAEDDLKQIHQILGMTTESLDNSTRQLTKLNETLKNVSACILMLTWKPCTP